MNHTDKFFKVLKEKHSEKYELLMGIEVVKQELPELRKAILEDGKKTIVRVLHEALDYGKEVNPEVVVFKKVGWRMKGVSRSYASLTDDMNVEYRNGKMVYSKPQVFILRTDRFEESFNRATFEDFTEFYDNKELYVFTKPLNGNL